MGVRVAGMEAEGECGTLSDDRTTAKHGEERCKILRRAVTKVRAGKKKTSQHAGGKMETRRRLSMQAWQASPNHENATAAYVSPMPATYATTAGGK